VGEAYGGGQIIARQSSRSAPVQVATHSPPLTPHFRSPPGAPARVGPPSPAASPPHQARAIHMPVPPPRAPLATRAPPSCRRFEAPRRAHGLAAGDDLTGSQRSATESCRLIPLSSASHSPGRLAGLRRHMALAEWRNPGMPGIGLESWGCPARRRPCSGPRAPQRSRCTGAPGCSGIWRG